MAQGSKTLAIAGLLMICPSLARAAVFEINGDGTVERLDAQPVRTTAKRLLIPDGRGRNYRPMVTAAAKRYEVSPALIDAIARTESRYKQAAVSRAGAVGVMQLMPGTARDLGVDSTDPEANIRGGTAYLRLLLNRFDGDVVRTIAAYNAGPGAVAKAGGVPRIPETVAYVGAVLDRLADVAN